MGDMVLEHVSKRFGDKQVLGGFSLALQSGSRVALLGPSGCGKTTLLRLLAGLERPDGGTLVGGAHHKLSMVFQEDRLLDNLSVRDNLLAVMEAGALPVQADNWLARVGLEGEGDKRPRQLSGGMQRRVALARALAYGGDVLLLDEPFKGLDRDTRNRMLDLVAEEVEENGTTTVLVTHDVMEAVLFATEIFRLSGPPLAVEDRVEVGLRREERTPEAVQPYLRRLNV